LLGLEMEGQEENFETESTFGADETHGLLYSILWHGVLLAGLDDTTYARLSLYDEIAIL